MPYNDRYGRVETNNEDVPYRIYMVTHGKWTIMGSCKTFQASETILQQLSDEFIQQKIKPRCEIELTKFWPEFKERFEYLSWTGSTLAKARTEKEFRGAFTFAEVERPVAHVFPGKVGCIFGVADEILQLINHKNIITSGHYKFVKEGILHRALGEITEKPHAEDSRNTCNLQTYLELIDKDKPENDTLSQFGIKTSVGSLKKIIQADRHSLWSPPPNAPRFQNVSSNTLQEIQLNV